MRSTWVCGGGNVAVAIAALTAPALVTGSAMDDVKLALARKAAAARGLANVRFQAMDLRDWHEHAAYDVVYARFVLQHLAQPLEMLGRTWEAVRAGGVLIVEDADFDGCACHPSRPGFAFFTRTYAEEIRRAGGDHAIGRKLYGYFLEASIGKPEIKVRQPAETT